MKLFPIDAASMRSIASRYRLERPGYEAKVRDSSHCQSSSALLHLTPDELVVDTAVSVVLDDFTVCPDVAAPARFQSGNARDLLCLLRHDKARLLR